VFSQRYVLNSDTHNRLVTRATARRPTTIQLSSCNRT
jgi:hypothetical protein